MAHSQREYYTNYGYHAATQQGQTLNRPEYAYIEAWIEPGTSILDLGCGEGSLGQRLIQRKQCRVSGLEISPDGVLLAQHKGIQAQQGDLDEGCRDYEDRSFDYVILNVTLQMVYRPGFVLQEALRVGKRVIVSFPNFGFWRCRAELLLKGVFPYTPLYGYHWHDTRHIHLFSYKDCCHYLQALGAAIIRQKFLGRDSIHAHWTAAFWPNLFSMVCILDIQGPEIRREAQ